MAVDKVQLLHRFFLFFGKKGAFTALVFFLFGKGYLLVMQMHLFAKQRQNKHVTKPPYQHVSWLLAKRIKDCFFAQFMNSTYSSKVLIICPRSAFALAGQA